MQVRELSVHTLRIRLRVVVHVERRLALGEVTPRDVRRLRDATLRSYRGIIRLAVGNSSKGLGLMKGKEDQSDWPVRCGWSPEEHLGPSALGDAAAANEKVDGSARRTDGAKLGIVWQHDASVGKRAQRRLGDGLWLGLPIPADDKGSPMEV